MKRILFVDDECNILDSIKRLLYADRHRWEMTFASDANSALRAFEQKGGFDIIISDVVMPGMNGVELLKIVRNRYPETARLILSGYAETALANRAISVAHQVISKPCQCDDLRTAIERVSTLQEVLSARELRAAVGTISSLPSLSKTYEALARAVQDPVVTVETIACIIEQDLAMSAKILQLVNGAFFGLAQKVTRVRDAVTFLGIDTIRDVALTSEAFTVFVPGPCCPEPLFETIQGKAHRAAAMTKVFDLDSDEKDVAIIAALLRDIGELIVACKMPDRFSLILEMTAARGCSRLVSEQEILGVTHAEIGAYLLGLWGLDSKVVEAIAHHHRPERIPHSRIDASLSVFLADVLTNELEKHPDDLSGDLMSETDRALLSTLGLTERFPLIREKAIRCWIYSSTRCFTTR